MFAAWVMATALQNNPKAQDAVRLICRQSNHFASSLKELVDFQSY